MLGCIHVSTRPSPRSIEPTPQRHTSESPSLFIIPSFFSSCSCGCNTTHHAFCILFLEYRQQSTKLSQPTITYAPHARSLEFHLMSPIRTPPLSVIWKGPGLPSVLVPDPGTTAVRSSVNASPGTEHRPLGSIGLGAARHHPLSPRSLQLNRGHHPGGPLHED